MKLPIEKLFWSLISCGVILLLGLAAYRTQVFNHSLFRLTHEQVEAAVSADYSECTTLPACRLETGDILLRRYITKRTWLMDRFAHPYFTHAAIYIGDGEIVEATGTEQPPLRDIQIEELSSSDWFDPDMREWVVIRPAHITKASAQTIVRNLRAIAADPEYTFGLPSEGYKRTTCADLIFEQLVDQQLVRVSDAPRIITPDYLFWKANDDPHNFAEIGYHL